MFARKEVFREHYLPTSLPGRAREVERLSSILRPAAAGAAPEHCWEFGPSGAGKTTTAQYLLKRLEGYEVAHAHVECVGKSRWELLQSITQQHPRLVPHGSMSTEQLLGLLTDNVTDPYVVILDEFDAFEAPAILTDCYSVDTISMLCIGHDQRDAERLVPDGADGLRHAPVVEFEPYSTSALLDILNARVDAGLQPDTVSDEHLERIAARVGGSARYGVQALRSAVELGVERGHTTVTTDDVDDCFERAQDAIREQLLNSLSRQHHIVYRVVREGEVGYCFEKSTKSTNAMQRIREPASKSATISPNWRSTTFSSGVMMDGFPWIERFGRRCGRGELSLNQSLAGTCGNKLVNEYWQESTSDEKFPLEETRTAILNEGEQIWNPHRHRVLFNTVRDRPSPRFLGQN